MLTNKEIREQFQHTEPRDRHDVEARRAVREKAAAFATFLNETLIDSSYKDDAIGHARYAMATALLALEQNGPTMKSGG